MASSRSLSSRSGAMLAGALLLLLSTASAVAQLGVGFYSKTCPHVEEIVRQEMLGILKEAPTLAGPFLRLHFHDCFVRGCDASVLIDSTDAASNPAEKDAPPNKSLRGFGAVQRVKDRLQSACPNTVSCADVLALMARDAVVLAGGPTWPVALGRRDGRVSIANETNQLPPPTSNFTRLSKMFGAKGLDAKDIVVLSGGHTLGTARCVSFTDRLYNFTGANNPADVDPALDAAYMFGAKGLDAKDIVVLSGGHTLGTARCVSFTDRLYNFTGANNPADVDPALDAAYVARLRSQCRSLADNTTLAEMDPGSFLTFDAGYYRLVAKRRGILHSDSALLEHPTTRAYVERQATGLFAAEFFRDFAESMVKMGNVGVLTGEQGEIRSKCYAVNK
uniref:Peroxidase n=1 Tax=Aegilops tauschii TaxID=37682 RepID=M8B309_AEGTA